MPPRLSKFFNSESPVLEKNVKRVSISFPSPPVFPDTNHVQNIMLLNHIISTLARSSSSIEFLIWIAISLSLVLQLISFKAMVLTLVRSLLKAFLICQNRRKLKPVNVMIRESREMRQFLPSSLTRVTLEHWNFTGEPDQLLLNGLKQKQ